MSCFSTALAELQPDADNRQWIYVPYDQLTDAVGPLSRRDPASLGIVMVENPWKADRRPYHRQKLALVLANGRHFALEQARRGVAVRFAVADGPYHTALKPLVDELGPIEVMRPAERELRQDLERLIRTGGLIERPHEGWLTTDADFSASQPPKPPWRMDAFYRQVRRRTGVLMVDGKPEGGKFSFDADNRKPWPGDPPAPAPPVFRPDEITLEVVELIEARFPHHPGEVDASALPATAADAKRLWQWAKNECLPVFGPYEDAISRQSRGLFHTRVSGLLNLHRLLPSQLVGETQEMDIPLSSKEGFIRQILGWREFVRHVHEWTDGFRSLPGEEAPLVAGSPGDAGWSRWSGRTWPASDTAGAVDGGACPSALNAHRRLPVGFWPGRPTGLHCLDRVLEDVWAEAWCHHIPRLMILCNIATLLEVEPRELADWFWVAYADAFDWVVEPNVLAMGTFGAGQLMTTKPYVSGAAYINRMSDYCGACTFNPRATCPITNLYWAFIQRHREILQDNRRMGLILGSLKKRGEVAKALDRSVFDWVTSVLDEGGTLKPEQRPETGRG